MVANGGISDQIQVLKETTYDDGGLTGEKVFGVTKRFEWKQETSTQQSYGLETSGPGATANTDGVILTTGTHEWELTDGREFEAIFGTLADPAAGTFSLDVATTLPSYTVKVIDSAADNTKLAIQGIKYTKFSLQVARGDEPVKVVADWVGKRIIATTTFTPTVATVEPLMFLDGCVSFGGTFQTEVEDITLEIDRKVVPRRFIESTTAGSRRLPSAAIEGNLVLTYNGNMGAQREVIEQIWGADSLVDVRSDQNILLRLYRGKTQLNLTMTGGRMVTTGRILEKEAEVALMDFAGVGLDITGTGSYAT